MKKLFFIEDMLANTISYYHLVCFLIALPFDRFYSELILISFVIHTLIHLKKDRLKLALSKEVIIVIAVYLVGLVCIVYSTDKKQALTEASIQLALALFPVTLACNGLNIKKYKLPLLKIFGFTCIIAIAYLYVDALLTIRYFHLPYTSIVSKSFMNHKFSAPFDIHATYLSMYVAFSICNFIFFCMKENSKGKRILYSFAIILLTAALFQLSSRAVVVALVVIVFLVFPFFLFEAKRKIIFISVASAGLVIILFAINHIDSFRSRYFNDFKKDLYTYTENDEITEPRMVRWEAILELVRRSPVIGYGSGSEVALLKEKYFEKKLYSSYLHQFNAHSEYLSFLIKSGITGLVIYLSVLVYGLLIALKKKDPAFMAFMILISITSVSENILDLNKGIFFYSFFFAFFLLVNKSTALKETGYDNRQPGELE